MDFRPVKQTDRSSVEEDHRRPKHQDAGVDGRSDRTLRSRPDVRQLQGERVGDVFHGSPADPVEERRKAVSPAQPGTFPKTGGERRTLTFNLLNRCLKKGEFVVDVVVVGLDVCCKSFELNVMIVCCLMIYVKKYLIFIFQT